MNAFEDFLMGAIAMASWIAGLFFLRLWRESRDRLYALFACAFWLEALARTALLGVENPAEAYPTRYLLRLVAYGLILFLISARARCKSVFNFASEKPVMAAISS